MKILKKKHIIKDPVEQRFDAMMELIKDLPKADYNRLKDAMDLGYNAYQKVRNVKTADEKELADIVNAEVILEKEVKNER
jgi:hypothetical protein